MTAYAICDFMPFYVMDGGLPLPLVQFAVEYITMNGGGGSLYLHNQLEQKIDLKTIDLSRQYNQKEAPAIINRSNGEQKETKTNKHTGIGVFCIIHKHRASVAVFDDSNGFGSIFCVLRHLPRDTSNAPRVVCIASQ